MIPPKQIPRFAPWMLILMLLPLLGPLPELLRESPAAHPVLLDREGRELTNFPREDYFRHQPVGLAEIPEHLIKATLAAEDKRFFEHAGFDFAATARAVFQNARHQRVTSGASTITQQLIKISTPKSERTFGRKLNEAMLARRLETRWTKDEILTAYLNRLDYGSHQQGCAAAARHFFGKPLADLSLAEAALLAGLPQAPSRLNPLRNPESAVKRRNWILDRLEDEFDYNSQLIARAKTEPVVLADREKKNPIPHLTRDFQESNQLSIDRDLQAKTHRIITEELERLEDQNVQHGALVVIKNATGEILAFHGSPDFLSSNGGQVNGALAKRSAGSSLKPFTYALAFENHGLYPGTVIADIPTDYHTAEGLDAPKNYDRRHRGPVSIRQALANSLNVPAMRMLNRLGGPELLEALFEQLEIRLDKPAHEYGLGLTIGNAEVSLLDLTNGYATLARGGTYLPVSFLRRDEANSHQQVGLSPESCFLIEEILSDNRARADAFGAESVLRLPFRCAVKTGTSSDFRDNWCLGFTSDYTVGVWVGNFDNSPMAGVSGVAGAGPIFRQTMLELHRNSNPTISELPAGLVPVIVDSRSGRRHLVDPGPQQAGRKIELCSEQHLPLPVSVQDYSEEGKVLLGREYSRWFHSIENERTDHFALGDSETPSFQALQILAPLPGATYYLDPELPGPSNRIELLANLGSGEWHCDSLSIDDGAIELIPGRHQIRFSHQESGQEIQCEFLVEEL